jgi:AcrR family transcriptional regulator
MFAVYSDCVSDATPRSSDGRPNRQPIWARPERGRRGPTPGYSRDDIASAAIAIADADGLAAVSMRAVAGVLGTSAGSLYRYLSSRDDLLDLMSDRAAAELRPYPTADGDWLDAMLLLGRRQLALYRRHRWLLDIVHRVSGIGPHTMAWFDNCLRVLQPVRCGVIAKFEAIAMMTGVATLFARSDATAPAISFAGIDFTAYPNLAAALKQPSTPPPHQDLFERTLRSLLTGLLTNEPSDQP